MIVELAAAVAAALSAQAAQEADATREARRAAQVQQRKVARSNRDADRAERFFASVWYVQSSEQPLGRRTINDNDYVVRARLLPPSLIRLSADAVEEGTNRVIVPAGTQLFGLQTLGAPIWCVVGRPMRTAAQRLFVGAVGNRQICLTDLDKNGVIDAHFPVGNSISGVPNFSGHRPNNARRIAAAAFERLDPSQVESEYFVGIRYEGLTMFGSDPNFSVSFGNERARDRLTASLSPLGGTNRFHALGAEFEIVSRQGETLEVDVRRNLQPQPFHVVQTVTYR